MATDLKKLAISRLRQLLPPELSVRDLWLLVSQRQHEVLLDQRRAAMVINRVKLFALIFAVLTPLWGLIDYWAFQAPLWYQLAGLRVLTSLAFAAMLFLYPERQLMRSAYQAMAVLFAIPTAFYIISHGMLAGVPLSELSEALATGYAFLPFVLMAGLAVFPLTLTENLMISMVILLAQLLAGYANWSVLNWPSFVAGTWLLVLIAGVVALASMSQLAFMLVMMRQSLLDPLTAAFTRGSGTELLELFWTKAQRCQGAMAVAFFDLDHFKSVNDQHGHEAGDEVLRQFACVVKKGIREQDMLVRWGGEEFILLMPATGMQQATQVLERLRSQGFGQRPDGSPQTASIGLAERLHESATSVQQLVDCADQRMYEAKKQGRNRLWAG